MAKEKITIVGILRIIYYYYIEQIIINKIFFKKQIDF